MESEKLVINVKVREGLQISQQEQNAREGEAQARQAWTMVGDEGLVVRFYPVGFLPPN